MTPTIIQVFYDSSAYPFKDKQLEVRFPIVGQAFAGASNTTNLRFYVGFIGGTSTTTWVANAKLPNGKKLYKILDSSSDDDGEYVELSLDETLTQVKGDLYIALNGYQGGVRIEEDSETHIYSVVGSPMIMATGVIKLSIVYAPVNDNTYIDETNEEITIQSLLGAITDRLEKTSGIVAIDSISLETASNSTNGQMVYDKSTDIFYQVVSGEYVKQQLVDIAYEYAPSGSDVILTIKLSDGLGVYKTLTINLTTYLASLTYVNAQLNTKVNRLSTSGLHAYTHNGSSQGEIEINAGAVGGSLPVRNANGQIIVPLTPTENNHATSKKYIDDLLAILNTAMQGYGKSLTIDETDFKLRLLNGNEEVLSTIDLPLEELIVDGEFDSETQTIILTLFNGNTIEIPVSDLVDGLVNTDDLATALASYYTKTQTDTLLSAKANSSDVYTKTETNNLLGAKQDTLVSGTNIKTINNTSILGSGNYAFDTAFNELSTNALENQVVAKEFREINYEIAMIREALFEVVLSEIDYSVDYAMTYVVPDTLTDTDGTHRVVYSETELKTISGNSVVDNQLVDYTYPSQTTTSNGITFTNNGDGSFTLSGVATDVARLPLNTIARANINGHYILWGFFNISSAISGVSLEDSYHGIFVATKEIRQWGTYNSGGFTQTIRVKNGTNLTTPITIVPMTIDLTKEFPTNTPTTLDDTRIQWLLSRGYIAHNTGSLLSTSVSGLESVGYNLCDEQWEQGRLNDTTGAENDNSNTVRSNYIEVLGGRTYTYEQPDDFIRSYSFYYYDKNKNYVGFNTWLYSSGYVRDITLSNNVAYVRITLYRTDLTPSQVPNICFHPTSNRTGYAPYVGTLSTITLPTTELKSAGSVHDYLEVVEGNVIEGEQRYNVVKHTLVGSVDLGILNWQYDSSNTRFRTISALENAKSVENIYAKNNLLSSKYVSMTAVDSSSGNVNMGVVISTYIFITNFGYTNADTFKTAMSGVMLYYELATEPTPTTIANDLTFEQVSLIIQQGGTINSNFTNVPPNVTTTFVVKKAVGE